MKLWTVVFVLFQLAWMAEAAQHPLVSTNAVWKYRKGTSAPDPAWRAINFDDSSWPNGRAPFHYGEGLSIGTALNDMRGNYSSFYLRARFVVEDPSSVQHLDLIAACDDGFIAWINGREIARYNVPAGNPAYNRFALSAVPEPVEWIRYFAPTPPSYLEEGENVLAVHVFNVSLTSSDIFFDGRLEIVPPDLEPPTIISIDPPPGQVSELNSIQVVFSEPVYGVDALGLLLNDSSPQEVTGSGAVYTFQFPQPPPGEILVRWDPGHGIIDGGRPPNSFDETVPEASWIYELVDDIPPTLLSVHPPPGTVLQQFSQVEVTFTEPVTGLSHSSLRANGQPALEVSGLSAGPYLFLFAPAPDGTVNLAWDEQHGITDFAEIPNQFQPVPFSYQVDSRTTPGTVLINEFLAANATGLRDEDGGPEDWIELYNPGPTEVNLKGWSITDDRRDPGQWIFPEVVLPSGQFLVVFASGKDRKPTAPGTRMHTNFKLSAGGEYLGLYNAESPRQAMSEFAPRYPEQRPDVSYGRAGEEWGYFANPTPGAVNGGAMLSGMVEPVHFSLPRGFYDRPVQLHLSSPTAGASIFYTLDGSEPTRERGIHYQEPISITRTMLVRAAAFEEGMLPSKIQTHTYLYTLSPARRSLPVLSLVTATNNLWGPTGIMEINPRNTTQRGIAWERPVSAELIHPWGNDGFQIDAGLRIQGGNYVRQRYDPRGSLPFSKYSFRLYFRGDYGQRQLEYPLIDNSPVQVFDRIVLRAGMNDHSNPFILDELTRRLLVDVGQVSSRGAHVNLFLNGAYQGYYNPTERIDSNFLRSWHGGEGDWDIMAQFGEIREGDPLEWNALRNLINTRDLAINANYQEVARRLDMVNFVDYLLVNIYGATGDWPHNNWRAARERVPGAKFRFYIWDAEWSFGYRNPVTHNTLANELGGDSDIARFYRRLRINSEFRLLFADRFHKHYLNDGGLTTNNVARHFTALRSELQLVLPNMQSSILSTWLPRRTTNVINHLRQAGLYASTNAPVLSQHGGAVPSQYPLTMSALSGTIYYTTNGVDPRVPFSGQAHPTALAHAPGQEIPIQTSAWIKARALDGENWSALTEAIFRIEELLPPVHITELMYQPIGGSAFEFIELKNFGSAPVDLSGWHFSGITFMFSQGTMLQPGQTVLLASNNDPEAFALRYPAARVHGYFRGNLANRGETIVLRNAQGRAIRSVTYSNLPPWPLEAAQNGHSLELISRWADPNAPSSWIASAQPGGSPGEQTASLDLPEVRINELMAHNISAVENNGRFPDWVELYNGGLSPVSLGGWSLTDSSNPRKFVFPQSAYIAAGDYLVVWLDGDSNAPGFHAGFSLSRAGETLALYDANTNRVDIVTFGPQITDLSLGRIGEDWALTVPTLAQPNTAAALGDLSGLLVNEWLARPAPGAHAWIELFNRSESDPVSLSGLGLQTGAGVFTINSLSFIPPRGFVRLWMDAGPGAIHVPLALDPEGDFIALHDRSGAEFERLTFNSQTIGISMGRLPDGSENIVAFPLSPSPGAGNFLPDYAGPLLNEILAIPSDRNVSSGWIELYHPGPGPFDLSGMSLGAGINPEDSRWNFPNELTISPDGYLLLRFDPSAPPSRIVEPLLNTGLRLPEQGGGVYLFNAQRQLAQKIEFGFQVPGQSIGRSGDLWRLLEVPTPAEPNSAPASLGQLHALRINEWLASNSQGPDWFELFNPSELPVQLTGSYLSDDPSLAGRAAFRIGPLSFIGPGGFVIWIADNDPAKGPAHLNFSLDRMGEAISFISSTLAQVDMISFGEQQRDVSQGRLPDGAGQIMDFDATASPGLSNYLPLEKVFIHEVLSHPGPGQEQAIEIANASDAATEISGWYLSNDPANLQQFRIPEGVKLGPGAFSAFYQQQFQPQTPERPGFLFHPHGPNELWLSEADENGNLTGYRDVTRFGPAEPGVSFGRFPTGAGIDFPALSIPTFSVWESSSLDQFRRGPGARNAYPKVGPIVITEIMYHPPGDWEDASDDNLNLEYIELRNLGPQPVALHHPGAPEAVWRFLNGVRFAFPPGAVIPPGDRVLVAGFNPADPQAMALFHSAYEVPQGTAIFGPFSGKLNNAGERLALYKPGHLLEDTSSNGMILVEQIDYSNAAPWPGGYANGGGYSLHRWIDSNYANDPANWFASEPGPGAPASFSNVLDSDGDGMPDWWELAHGLDPHDPADAVLDLDGDGLTNLEEFQAGTDPRNPFSALAFHSVRRNDGAVELRFFGVGGKDYSVEFTSDPALGQWERLIAVPSNVRTELIEVQDASLPPSANRFYRLRLE
jgi:hypothetical protein